MKNYVLTIRKGKERFTFIFRGSDHSKVIQRAAQMADNPALNFDWCDVLVVMAKLKERAKEVAS